MKNGIIEPKPVPIAVPGIDMMSVRRKKARKQKHIPIRTCVGCRQVNSKRTLIRIVTTKDGIVIDSSGKLAGRGAYLHASLSCWQNGLQGRLEKALKVNFTESDIAILTSYMKNLPDEKTGKLQ